MIDNSLLNNPIDISQYFKNPQANYFFFSKLLSFNKDNLTGTVLCKRYKRKIRLSFNQEMLPFEETQGWEFPDDYGNDKVIPFTLVFYKDGSLRLKFDAYKTGAKTDHLVPLVIEKFPKTISKKDLSIINDDDVITISSPFCTIKIQPFPFKIILLDNKGNVQIETVSIHEKIGIMNDNPIPCGFIQETRTENRKFVFSSFLSVNEKIFGCGESFTSLNKRGQIINIFTNDPKGVSTSQMYKPIPYFSSNNNYSCLIHSSCPMTFDFGNSYSGVQTIFLDEECLDLFIFEGTLKQSLSKYTNLTGKSPMVPEWSFGLWMGRITYNSQEQVENVANKLKENDIPCSVIHIDTGWFSNDWRCDYSFDTKRFPQVKEMLDKLHSEGFRVSLWQLPYFTPQNPLFSEMINNKIAIENTQGDIPTEDAIIDLTNPQAVKWYQEKLQKLLEEGVDIIKADFGEAAPFDGMYYNNKSGHSEHNLYPLRYNKAVSEITQKVKNYPLIWARSAWAGSQRYPVHWGGDAETTNNGMIATLRGGLSLGLCGFSFWSHDLGGFVKPSPPDLYLRWLAMGMFSSHARCHGNPPREPWDYDGNFINEFRKLVKIREKLMPYIIKEAENSSQNGWPMIRTLFFEFPEDNNTWNIEDEYLFGSQLLVAPLFTDNTNSRDVYLPAGNNWEDYFTHASYAGGKWYKIDTKNHIIVLRKILYD